MELAAEYEYKFSSAKVRYVSKFTPYIETAMWYISSC